MKNALHFILKVQSCKLKEHWYMIAYVFQKYPENVAVQLFIFCINLPQKFAMSLKTCLLFNIYCLLFPFIGNSIVFYKKNVRLNNLKSRAAMNVKISVFLIFWPCKENDLIRKTRLISKFMTSQPG